MLYKSKNPHGGDIYEGDIRLDFSANTNPLGTPERVIEAAADSLKVCDRYPDPYARELVGAISEYHGIDPDLILIGAGAAELIYSYTRSFGFGKALLMAPTFSEYELGLKAAGDTEIIYFPLSEDKGFTPDDGIIDLIKAERPDAVFICNPNNPSGKLMDPGLLSSVHDLTKKLGIRMFLDECFIELSEGTTLIPELKDDPNLTILRAFTKNYGMAGLRLGYVLSSDEELLKRMSSGVQPWNISTPAQAAGVQALKERDFLKKSIEIIRDERRFLLKGMRELGLQVFDSDVNYLLFRGPVSLFQDMRREGILIRNCDNYVGLGPGWYRVAVKLHDENEELLKTLKKVL